MATRPGVSALVVDASDPSLLVGKILDGRFRLDEVIEIGGMGVVFRATQLNIRRVVAVKLMRPELNRDPGLMTRFARETELISQLSHPNIVPLIDGGRDRHGLAYYVMEYVEGMTFAEALRRRRLSLLDLLEVFVQVANALIEAHHLYIIHRDLKLENIMIARQQDHRIHVKVLDFGIARQLTRTHGERARGELPGTPGTIAPELIAGEEPSAASDLYSVGVMMFTALAGRPPFEAEDDDALLQAHLHDAPPNLYALVGDRVPEAALDLAAELLVKSPQRRPSSAQAVRDRLEAIVRELRLSCADHPRYQPPGREVEREAPVEPPSFRDVAIEDLRVDDKASPAVVVAPVSIVAFLLALVTVLVLALAYLIFRQHLGQG